MARTGKSSVRIIPRKYRKDGIVTVKTRIIHPQQNGRLKDDDGRYIPPHYITGFRALYGGEEVLAIQSSPGISRNPFFNFTLQVTKSAPLKIIWRDNQNNEYSNTVDLKI